MTLEQLAKKIFDEAKKDGEPVTKEESLEMAEMEIKAKGIKNYTRSAESSPRKNKAIKLDAEKVAIIRQIFSILEEVDEVENLSITNPQKEITFILNDNNYSIYLTKHKKSVGKS